MSFDISKFKAVPVVNTSIEPTPSEPKKKDNTLIILAVIAVVVIIVIFYLKNLKEHGDN